MQTLSWIAVVLYGFRLEERRKATITSASRRFSRFAFYHTKVWAKDYSLLVQHQESLKC